MANPNVNPINYQERSPALDVLRFFAVMLVLCRHSYICPAEFSPALHKVTAFLVEGGWVGVDLFFVLSGFLIAGLLFAEQKQHGNISFPHFFMRRGFRIYPPLWMLLAFTWILLASAYLPERDNQWVWHELLFVQNYAEPCLWGYTWSLAVEEHFYLLLPLALKAMASCARDKNRPFRAIPGLFAAVACFCLLLRLINAEGGEFRTQTHLIPTHLRFDSLFFGVLLAYYYHYCREGFQRFVRKGQGWLVVLGIGLVAPAFFFPLASTPYLYTFGFTQFYCGCGLILAGCLGITVWSARGVKGIATIGASSYSMYLWHGPAAFLAREIFRPELNLGNWFGWTFIFLSAAIVMGVGMARAVELPILRFRDARFPSRSRR
jgi:peptidoglycan/LPS O-acetylase OafA/YrhL